VAAALTVCAIAAAAIVVRSGDANAPATPAALADAQGRGHAQNVQRLWRDFAQCLRTHGYPQIADPAVLPNGDLSFGTQGAQFKAASRALGRSTCSRQFALLEGPGAQPPPSAAELHQMVLFSRCMRQHGVPDWPDPRADGTYPLNQRLVRVGKRGVIDQLVVCAHFIPGEGIVVSASSKPKTATKP
jgi:hypothetical protein